jgi:outer membrane protein assembly factor BamB
VRDPNGFESSNPPAVGADGSLYFVYNQTAYGLNPDLQELWNIPLSSSSTSRITVGPSGRFVYLTVNGQGLLAIKAQTGRDRANRRR